MDPFAEQWLYQQAGLGVVVLVWLGGLGLSLRAGRRIAALAYAGLVIVAGSIGIPEASRLLAGGMVTAGSLWTPLTTLGWVALGAVLASVPVAPHPRITWRSVPALLLVVAGPLGVAGTVVAVARGVLEAGRRRAAWVACFGCFAGWAALGAVRTEVWGWVLGLGWFSQDETSVVVAGLGWGVYALGWAWAGWAAGERSG